MSRKRLVMLRPLGLGDFLTGVPAMRALARAFPEHQHLLAAPARLAPLATLTGAIDRVVETAPLSPLPPACNGADIAVDLHGRGPESHGILLAARPGRLIAFAHPNVPASATFPRWRDEEHEVRRWCRLLIENGIPANPDELDLPAPGIAPPLAAVGAVVIHPGAAYPARRWPWDRWVRVARALGPKVVITAGPGEEELARTIARHAGLQSGHVLADVTGLLELAAVVAGARLLISGDTGVAHLATALGTPSVILFGPMSPARWGPPPDRRWHRAIWKGHNGDPHGAIPDPGLLAITVEEVLAAVSSLSSGPTNEVRDPPRTSAGSMSR